MPDFEQLAHGELREYMSAKAHNFATSVAAFPQLWEAYHLLDDIFCKEFSDTQNVRDESLLVPALIYRDAHARFRVAMELGFSGCINDAFNALRFGIEAVYHARKILRSPELSIELAQVWLKKADDTDEARKAFRKAFDEGKREAFIECGLTALHHYWSDFSELSHSNIKAMAVRLMRSDTGQLNVDYLETDPKIISGALFLMLLAGGEMEAAL
jgi:hypothetical protein